MRAPYVPGSSSHVPAPTPVRAQTIVAGIESVEVDPGRCEINDEGQAFPVIVDEAATPEAFSRLLDMVKEVGARRVFTVFGCEGDRDRAVRPVLGEIAHYKVSIH